VILQWIPGHRGIPGNDRADSLAKSSNTYPRTIMMVPTEDYYQVITNNIKTEWLQQWHSVVRTEAKGKHLFSIKDNLDFWPWSSHQVRVVETAVARLRVGHAGTAQHLFRFGMHPTPLCNCGEIESISHLLLECQLHEEERNNLKDAIKNAQITIPISVKMLLGGEKLSNRQQFVILNCLHIYLRNINKLHIL